MMEHTVFPCCNTAIEIYFSLCVLIVCIACFVQVQTFFSPLHAPFHFHNHSHFHSSSTIQYAVLSVH
jgi:hypothetical protein